MSTLLTEGGFYDGMVPDVLANDDITRDFGDPEELIAQSCDSHS